MKIWFLTRSLYPYQKTGGGQIRLGQIAEFRNLGWNVHVVMPNYDKHILEIHDNIHFTPYTSSLKWSSRLQRIGYYEDYLDPWINVTFKYLNVKIEKKDIVFATSGGELGAIKLGSLLKKNIGCKFIINFHDPLSYSVVNGLKIDNNFHASRELKERKYLLNSDAIITSSKVYSQALKEKYPNLKYMVQYNYFGYMNKTNLNNYLKIKSDKLKIAYVGTMSFLQKPEILYEAYNRLDIDVQSSIEIYYIGSTKDYKPLQKIKNVFFIDYLEHDEFIKFMIENIDIGFVSLTNDYLGACVPSKIYEYINLGLPMIGALPNGDGKDIINENKYGIVNHYKDIDGLANTIKKFLDNEFLNSVKLNILKDKEDWSMKNRILEVHHLLENL